MKFDQYFSKIKVENRADWIREAAQALKKSTASIKGWAYGYYPIAPKNWESIIAFTKADTTVKGRVTKTDLENDYYK